jgi:hypothetical protein
VFEVRGSEVANFVLCKKKLSPDYILQQRSVITIHITLQKR